MNGIWIETQDQRIAARLLSASRNSWKSISVVCEGDAEPDDDYPDKEWDAAEYDSKEVRDEVWERLMTAIATGVRLFRFPTQEEIEKEMQECD